MDILIWFVALYWIASVAIGVYVGRRVKNTNDYALAGRALPFPVIAATVFATWFGAEAVLGAPATFIKDGFLGIIADPFGTSMCLILVGILFAKKLYRMNLMTISDFYRARYGRAVEVIVSMSIVISYLGWVAAQVKALGLVINVVSGGYISMEIGMVIGAVSVLIYTLIGGMLSVAITDFIQMIIIIVGLLYLGWEAADLVGGVNVVVEHAYHAGNLSLIPPWDAKEIFWIFGAWITMLLGSMPQQDVFQRMASAKTEDIAQNGTIFGGVIYFLFAMIPLFLCYSTVLLDPALVANYIGTDSQMIMPKMIMKYMPIFAQVMFFGALIAAIKSTASATLLAPAVTFAENIIGEIRTNMTDKQELFVMRAVVFCFAIVVTVFALITDASIFEMVENAYKATLVAAFVPLFCGFYWKKANNNGALTSIIMGATTWIVLEFVLPDWIVPPQLFGFVMAIVGMVVGSLWIKKTSTLATSDKS